MTTKILTFESWVTRYDWFLYAQAHPEYFGQLLIDRSPCQDPFFEPFAPSPDERRPLISGLCRRLRNFTIGQRYIYITKIDPKALEALERPALSQPQYFAVASLIVYNVWDGHTIAADHYEARRYISTDSTTPHPPNLTPDRITRSSGRA